MNSNYESISLVTTMIWSILLLQLGFKHMTKHHGLITYYNRERTVSGNRYNRLNKLHTYYGRGESHIHCEKRYLVKEEVL